MEASSFICTQSNVRNSLPLNTHKVPKINCMESSFERNSRYFTRGPCLPQLSSQSYRNIKSLKISILKIVPSPVVLFKKGRKMFKRMI